MGTIRQYPRAYSLQPTDAFIIDRAGVGTMYIETQNMNFGNAVVSNAFQVAMGFTGALPALQAILVFNAATPFTLPINLTGSQFSLQAAPTSDLYLTLNKNSTAIGEVIFAANSTAATVTFSSAVSFTAGDELKVVTPADTFSADTVALTFVGVKN